MSYRSSRHQNLAYPLSMGHRTAVLYSEGHVQCTLPNHFHSCPNVHLKMDFQYFWAMQCPKNLKLRISLLLVPIA